MRRMTRAAFAVAVAVTVTGCGGDGGGPGPTAGADEPLNTWTPTPGGDASSTTRSTGTTSSPASSATSPASTESSSSATSSSTSTDTGTPFDPQEFTSRLRSAVEKHPTVAIEVEATLGGQQSVSANGTQDLEEDALDMTVDMGGQELGYRLVDGRYYLAQPPKWVPVTEESTNPLIQQTLEQVQLLSMRKQLDAFLAGVEAAGDKGSEEIDGVTTRHYTATVDTAKAQAELGRTKDPGAPDSLVYDVWLDEDHLIRQMTFTQDGARATMTATDWGDPVTIDPPKDSEIAQAPDSGTA